MQECSLSNTLCLKSFVGSSGEKGIIKCLKTFKKAVPRFLISVHPYTTFIPHFYVWDGRVQYHAYSIV